MPLITSLFNKGIKKFYTLSTMRVSNKGLKTLRLAILDDPRQFPI